MAKGRRVGCTLAAVCAAAAIGTVLVGVSLVGPGYFQEAMGHQPGDPAGQQMDELTLSAFHEAIRTALVAAAATALAATTTSTTAATASGFVTRYSGSRSISRRCSAPRTCR